MSAQWKWLIGIVSIVVVFALLACGIFFGWRYFFPGKPSVVIAAPPSNYQAVEGEEVTVEARATGRSIVRVELWVDDGLVDSASSPSPQDAFSAALMWQASGVGSHTVEVRAHDARGQASDPAAIVLIVATGVAEVTPTVSVGPEFETPTPTATPSPTPTSPPGATPTPTSPPPTATPTLGPPSIDSYTIDDSTITDGETTYLRWEFHNATESHLYRDAVEIDSGLSSPGNRPVNPAVTRTFKLVVSNAAGSAEASVTLTVNPAGPPVIDFFTADPPTINVGDSSTLSWGSVTNATSVEIDQGIGGVGTPGSVVVSPATTTTYTMTAVGPGGMTPASVTVTVIPAGTPYTEYVYEQVTIAAGSTGAAIATCPATSVVVGGGFAANPSVAFYTQYKYDNGWRGDAKNNSGSSKQITVYAVCLHNASGASVTQVHGQVDVPAGTRKQAVATCPAGSIATGGGFHAYPDGSLRVYNSSKADSGEGWQSWADNLSGSTKTHHAYAICLSGTGGTTARILKSAAISAGNTGYAIPTCPGGALVTGGGFAAQDDLIIYSSSGPYSDDEWRVYVQNTHSSDDRTLFGYAICLSIP